MSQTRKILRQTALIGIGIGLMAGIGYFAPALMQHSSLENERERFVAEVVKERFPNTDIGALPAYDAYLSHALERVIGLYVGQENVRAVVRADLAVRREETVQHKIIKDSAVVKEERTEQKEDGSTVKNTVFDYTTETTRANAVFYDVRKVNALVFVAYDAQQNGLPLQENAYLKKMTATAIGLDETRGDMLQLVAFPASENQNKLFGAYDLQIRQIVAVALICMACVFFVAVLLIPWLLVKFGRIHPLPEAMPRPETKDMYRYQIIGNVEDNLMIKTQAMCLEMPEAAVNVLRNWLAEESKGVRRGDLFSPAQKAAIVLLCIGERGIKTVFRCMTDAEIFSLSRLMASLGQVKAIDIQPILLAFCQSMTMPQDIRETKPLVESLIRNALPADKATALLSEMKIVAKGKSVWEKLSTVPSEKLSCFLASEYPQTAAVILYHLSTEKGAEVLTQMDERAGARILIRLSALQYLNPNNVRMIERELEQQIESLLSAPVGMGEEKASAILSLLDSETQSKYMSSMEKVSPQTAGLLAKRVFCFDDLASWSGDDLRTLLKHIDSKTLITALINAKDETKEAFSRVVNPQKWSAMLKKINQLPMGKIQDIDISQRAIIQIARQLVESKKCKGSSL